MKGVRFIAAGFTAILQISIAGSAVAEQKSGSAQVFEVPEKAEAILDRYCYNCHDE